MPPHNRTDHSTTTQRDRLAEVQRLTGEMERTGTMTEGQFNALGMLVTDASLTADEPALQAAHKRLQWLYRLLDRATEPEQAERRGRLLGLIDVTHWALRRLPAALGVGFHAGSHAARFLLAVARERGLSNQDLATRLAVDETEVSRVGRRLMAAGVVWRRKDWKRNAWDITPRGRTYLESIGESPDAVETADTPPVEATPHRPPFTLGIKVLPDRLIGVATNDRAAVLATLEQELPDPLPADRVVARLSEFVTALLDVAPDEVTRDSVGLGVEIGGHVHPETGRIVYAPNYAPDGAWANLDLADLLSRATGIPTVIDNDANALAQFELSFGSQYHGDSFATILLDRGVGCGLAIDGKVLHGARGSAGEIGHVVVEQNGRRCTCGNEGCLESVCGSVAINEIAEEHAERHSATTPPGEWFRNVPLPVDSGKGATEAYQRAGRALGRGISALLNLVNPEQLVIYGPPELVSEAHHGSAQVFMGCVREASEQYSFSNAGTECQLVTEPYGYEFGARAAASLALTRIDWPVR